VHCGEVEDKYEDEQGRRKRTSHARAESLVYVQVFQLYCLIASNVLVPVGSARRQEVAAEGSLLLGLGLG